MTRMTMFDNPLFLGFENLERTLDRIAKSSAEGYPPYNIEQLDEQRLRITLAVAGFSEEDLDVRREGNQLVVSGGRRREEDGDRVFLHRGIASRQFQRSFLLAEGIEIDDASLHNGLLNVDLHRPTPEPEVQRITINKGNRGSGKKTVVDVSDD